MKLYNERNRLINHENIEVIEQQLTKKYVKPNDRVLELGARYGSVSIITNQIINDKQSHYVVEPDACVWDALENNMKINNCNFNIIKGIIGKKKYKLVGSGYAKKSVVDESYGKSQIELFDLPDVNFNTLIIDCEGYLETFYDENKELFLSVDKMIIECDEPSQCDYPRVFKEFEKLNFKVVEHINYCNLDYYVFMKPKTLVVSLSDRPHLSDKFYKSNAEYFKRYDIDFLYEKTLLTEERHPSWNKILLLQRELKKDYDYVVWMDDDILITNHTIDLNDIIAKYEFDNILIDDNAHIGKYKINCGMFVCKNNDTTKEFLQSIWDNAKPEHYFGGVWENDTFQEYLKNNPENKMLKIIPHKVLQSFKHCHSPEDFSIHFAGRKSDKLMKRLDNYIKNIVK